MKHQPQADYQLQNVPETINGTGIQPLEHSECNMQNPQNTILSFTGVPEKELLFRTSHSTF